MRQVWIVCALPCLFTHLFDAYLIANWHEHPGTTDFDTIASSVLCPTPKAILGMCAFYMRLYPASDEVGVLLLLALQSALVVLVGDQYPAGYHVKAGARLSCGFVCNGLSCRATRNALMPLPTCLPPPASKCAAARIVADLQRRGWL